MTNGQDTMVKKGSNLPEIATSLRSSRRHADASVLVGFLRLPTASAPIGFTFDFRDSLCYCGIFDAGDLRHAGSRRVGAGDGPEWFPPDKHGSEALNAKPYPACGGECTIQTSE